MSTVFIAFFTIYLKNEVINPIRELVKGIKKIESGGVDYRVPNLCTNNELKTMIASFNGMMAEIWKLKIESYEKKLKLQDVKLKYFQMQIKPHFFLNALSTIHSLTYQGKIEEIRTPTRPEAQRKARLFRGDKEISGRGRKA